MHIVKFRFQIRDEIKATRIETAKAYDLYAEVSKDEGNEDSTLMWKRNYQPPVQIPMHIPCRRVYDCPPPVFEATSHR